MQLKAKLIQVLPLQTGASNNGTWKKQDIIVETYGQYPKKVLLSIWGDKVNPEVLIIDKKMLIDIDIESREYNGKWYTDVKAWNIQLDESSVNSDQKSNLVNKVEEIKKWLELNSDSNSGSDIPF
jgi:hypothetical protein